MLFCVVYQEVFDHLATIPDLFGRFPKTPEDSRRFPKTTKDVKRLPKMSEDYRSFQRRVTKIFDYIFIVIFTCLSHVKDIFLHCKGATTFFSLRNPCYSLYIIYFIEKKEDFIIEIG